VFFLFATFLCSPGNLQTGKVKAITRTYAWAIQGTPSYMFFNSTTGLLFFLFSPRVLSACCVIVRIAFTFVASSYCFVIHFIILSSVSVLAPGVYSLSYNSNPSVSLPTQIYFSSASYYPNGQGFVFLCLFSLSFLSVLFNALCFFVPVGFNIEIEPSSGVSWQQVDPFTINIMATVQTQVSLVLSPK
jgi:hypothetical protein